MLWQGILRRSVLDGVGEDGGNGEGISARMPCGWRRSVKPIQKAPCRARRATATPQPARVLRWPWPSRVAWTVITIGTAAQRPSWLHQAESNGGYMIGTTRDYSLCLFLAASASSLSRLRAMNLSLASARLRAASPSSPSRRLRAASSSSRACWAAAARFSSS